MALNRHRADLVGQIEVPRRAHGVAAYPSQLGMYLPIGGDSAEDLPCARRASALAGRVPARLSGHVPTVAPGHCR
jgi:hypothetical protein